MPRLCLALLITVLLGAGCDSAGDGAALADTRWSLLTADVPGEDRPPAGDILVFFRSGGVDVASCNACSGRFRVEGGRVFFYDFGCTEMYCSDRLDLGPLLWDEDGVEYEVAGDRLTLRVSLPDGQTGVLTFAGGDEVLTGSAE
ncbi:MAG: META domain-containing protein [Rhodothermales bacterium]|nr:META domain-containing protein [Rhodothermales bacterium]